MREVSLRLALSAVTLAGSLGCNAVLGIEELDGGSGVDAAVGHDATMGSVDGATDAGRDHSQSASRDAAIHPTDAHRHDAEASAPEVDAGCGTIVVIVTSDFNVLTDTEGVLAVANGEEDTAIAVNDAGYAAERKKAWYLLSPEVTPVKNVAASVSACVPPGSYALEYWDIKASTTNNGVPPTNTLPWQIGLSSMTIDVAVGATTTVDVDPTESNNVPTEGSFSGTWASWAYGDCTGGNGCPASTTCYMGVCYDMGYDVRNCGMGGMGCVGKTCCAGACVDTASSSANCGTCGNSCGGGNACMAGACQ